MRFPPQLIPWLLLAVALLLAFFTRGILLPFLVGMAVAYLLDPLADRLESRGVSRGLAAALILAAFFLAGVGIVLALWPLLQGQIAGLMRAVPGLLESIRGGFDNLLAAVNAEFGGEVTQQAEGVLASAVQEGLKGLGGMMQSVFSSGVAVLMLLSLLVVSPMVAFYMLRDFDRIIAHLDGVVPSDYKPAVHGAMGEIDDALSGFVRGQLTVMAVMAVLYAIGWTAVGLEYSLVLGLFAGLLAFIPVVGMVFAAAVALAVGVGQWGLDWINLGLVAGVWALVQALEASYLTPRLMSHHINLHPVWVLFAVFAGGEIAGFVGVLLAVPAAAVISVLTRRSLTHYRARMDEKEGAGSQAAGSDEP